MDSSSPATPAPSAAPSAAIIPSAAITPSAPTAPSAPIAPSAPAPAPSPTVFILSPTVVVNGGAPGTKNAWRECRSALTEDALRNLRADSHVFVDYSKLGSAHTWRGVHPLGRMWSDLRRLATLVPDGEVGIVAPAGFGGWQFPLPAIRRVMFRTADGGVWRLFRREETVELVFPRERHVVVDRHGDEVTEDEEGAGGGKRKMEEPEEERPGKRRDTGGLDALAALAVESLFQ